MTTINTSNAALLDSMRAGLGNMRSGGLFTKVEDYDPDRKSDPDYKNFYTEEANNARDSLLKSDRDLLTLEKANPKTAADFTVNNALRGLENLLGLMAKEAEKASDERYATKALHDAFRYCKKEDAPPELFKEDLENGGPEVKRALGFAKSIFSNFCKLAIHLIRPLKDTVLA